MKKQVVIFLIMMSVLVGYTRLSLAGEYILQKRSLLNKVRAQYSVYPKASDPGVCKAYKKNLNSFPDVIHPMTCDRQISSDIKGFDKLEWKETSDNKWIGILTDAVLYGERPKIVYDEKNIRKNIIASIKDNISKNTSRLSIVRIDIDNDKRMDLVLREAYFNIRPPIGCIDGKYTGSSNSYNYYIFDESNNKLTFKAKQTRYFKYKSGSAFNVFRYNNRTYLDTWQKDYIDPLQYKKKQAWYLKVYETYPALSSIGKRLVCEYRYKK